MGLVFVHSYENPGSSLPHLREVGMWNGLGAGLKQKVLLGPHY